jgi:FkbM family methyltransferase
MTQKKKVLVYCGTNNGQGFMATIMSEPWDAIYGFEANPALYEKVKNGLAHDPRVKMYNTILSDTHGEQQDFFIIDANNTGHEYSSSVVNTSDWLPEYEKMSGNKMEVKETIKLSTTNLNTFLQEEGIEEIDFLLTDLEGSDLLVMSTMKDWVTEGRIRMIQCEVEPDHMPCKYVKLNNKYSGFKELLEENYELIAKYQDMPHYFAVDHRWVLKDEQN